MTWSLISPLERCLVCAFSQYPQRGEIWYDFANGLLGRWRMKRKLTTIMAMDVVGYSGLMEQNEESTHEELKHLRSNLVNPAIASHEGRVIKLIGDGTLVEFPSVVGALQCAMEIQQKNAQSDVPGAGQVESPLKLRIGLHVGDVIVDDDDIYGDGVNVAARLESLAEPGTIVLSKQVHDHIGLPH